MTEGNIAADQLRQFIERIEHLEGERKSLAADVRDIYSEAKACGFDPKARALGGGDENSLTDMGRVIASCNNLSKATGAHVMLIHHSGKDEEKGMRGHSSLKAAADTVIKITKPDRGNPYTEAQVEKQKDLPIGNAMPFVLRDVHLGSDSKGEASRPA